MGAPNPVSCNGDVGAQNPASCSGDVESQNPRFPVVVTWAPRVGARDASQGQQTNDDDDDDGGEEEFLITHVVVTRWLSMQCNMVGQQSS